MENESQKEAINFYNGSCLVLSGPGSGKTFVLTNRVYNLITKLNVEPTNVLVITFTRQAANEMKNRFEKICSDNKTVLYSNPTFGTFHSVFFEILRNDFDFNNESLITLDEEKKYIMSILERKNNMKLNTVVATNVLKEIKSYKLSKEKEEKFVSNIFTHKEFEKVYSQYQCILKENKKLDFYDMVEFCYDMLKKNKNILNKYREQYKYILIDEFQDINKSQYDIIKLICKTKNIFVVGDDDQSIYKFRGSKPTVMNDFLKDFKKTTIITLNTNYRSSNGIVKFSKKVIDNNKQRFAKNLMSNKKNYGNIEIRYFKDSIDENKYILNIIKNNISNNKKLSDIAILFRTNLMSNSIIETLSKENINFIVKDIKNNSFNHFSISDILSYFKLSLGEINHKNILNIMNKPLRYISRECVDRENVDIQKMIDYYNNQPFIKNNIIKFNEDLKIIKTLQPSIAIKYIRLNIGYEKYIVNYCKSKNISYEEVKEILDEFEELAIRFKNIGELVNFVDNYMAEINKHNYDNKKNEEAVSLMTFHSCKGLEFETVILIDANDGIIPHKKSIEEKDIESERRLFYVAITRAKENLHIFFTTHRNGKNYQPSRFIIEGLKGDKNE